MAKDQEIEALKSRDEAWYRQPWFLILTGVASTLLIIAVGAPILHP